MRTTCLLCRSPVKTVGLCSAHYKRFQRGWRGERLKAPIVKRYTAQSVAKEIRQTDT